MSAPDRRTQAPRILPLCTVDEVRAELADTDDSLRATPGRTVSPERRQERRAILERWRDRLQAQLAEMEATDG